MRLHQPQQSGGGSDFHLQLTRRLAPVEVAVRLQPPMLGPIHDDAQVADVRVAQGQIRPLQLRPGGNLRRLSGKNLQLGIDDDQALDTATRQ